MGRIILSPALTKKEIDKLTGICPLPFVEKRECVCKEWAHTKRPGPCPAGIYFRQPDLPNREVNDEG